MLMVCFTMFLRNAKIVESPRTETIGPNRLTTRYVSAETSARTKRLRLISPWVLQCFSFQISALFEKASTEQINTGLQVYATYVRVWECSAWNAGGERCAITLGKTLTMAFVLAVPVFANNETPSGTSRFRGFAARSVKENLRCCLLSWARRYSH